MWRTSLIRDADVQKGNVTEATRALTSGAYYTAADLETIPSFLMQDLLIGKIRLA